VLSLNHVIGDVEQMLRRSIGEHIHLDLVRALISQTVMSRTASQVSTGASVMPDSRPRRSRLR
jgi:hypothetical protein